MSVETPRAGYITKSSAGHDLEDELAIIPGRPYDWYESLLSAAIEGEIQVHRAGGREMAHQAAALDNVREDAANAVEKLAARLIEGQANQGGPVPVDCIEDARLYAEWLLR